ncbi:MAG: Rrf2 family transcriptional regulator [Chloroflexi bacterium]|nr:Rrf2 family transcriptional regulator [Chloroflexota bacterium]
MELTRGSDYATRGMIRLARLPHGTVAQVSEIAQQEALPESYLAKIFQDLAKNGIIHSHRGASGGFSLARPADQITLRQMVEAIEGPIYLQRCLAPWEHCDKADCCALYPILAKAQADLLALLDGTSLHELAATDRVPPVMSARR